jgi:50S ribosomal protein L16 3-hydroxylase
VYADPSQEATGTPGEVPARLQQFAAEAVRAALREPLAMGRALGEYLTEPKASVWFDAPASVRGALREVALDRRTRMMYDAQHVFINGESYRASGRDARLMRLLADRRSLGRDDLAGASPDALALLQAWREAGWIQTGSSR